MALPHINWFNLYIEVVYLLYSKGYTHQVGDAIILLGKFNPRGSPPQDCGGGPFANLADKPR